MRRLIGSRAFLVALFGGLALLPAVANTYQLFIGNLIMLYILLAVGLNLLIGYAGQLAFANAAMYGIGAYSTGLLMVKAGWPFWAAAPVGAVAAMLIGMAIALPALRLSGIYLAMATLAFAQFIQWAMLHWEGFTYGAGGFKVRQVDFAPLPLDPDHGIYYLSLLVTIVMVVLAANLVRSRLGRAFVAMRDGEIAAQALGIDLLRYKAMAFAISGFYAGVAGGLYCALLNFVSPESFDLFQMVLHKAMVVVGGLGSVLGSVLGATLLVSAIEMLRQFKGTQEIVFGGLLLGFVLFQPNGLVSLLKRWVPGWDEPLHLRAAGERHTAEAPVPVRTPAEQEG